MTDRDKIDFLAQKMGTLKRRTQQHSYISDVRLKWNELGEVVAVDELVKGRGWEPVK